ncbi:MAG: hypothetical protein ACQ9MH_22605 [Nitrospinales bacterium]
MKKYRRNRLIIIVSLTAFFITCLMLVAAPQVIAHKHPRIFVEGVPMRGTANGMFFDEHDRLWVANIWGRSISVLDPESGEVLMRLGPAEGVIFPDDLTFSPDGSLFWTDPLIGAVSRITPGGAFLFPAFGFPGANPITMSDDGELFFAQCFQPETNIYEADPLGIFPPEPILPEPDEGGCAANGMDYWDGFLYLPRWYEGRVVKVDIDTGDMTEITADWGVPAAVKFDSQGTLHAVNQGNGEVVTINLDTGDRELLAQLPIGLDNLAFDSNDRLYVSSSVDGFVVEIMPDGSVRTVSPGGMAVAGGVAVIGRTVYVNEPQAIRGFNRKNGKQVSVTRSAGIINPVPIWPMSMAADGEHLILMSWFFGDLVIWDPETESVEFTTLFAGPVDAQRFQGDLIVSELFTGNVVRASGPDLGERETLAELTVPTGLAATDDDLYVSDSAMGKIFQIIRDSEILIPPIEIASGLERPEGIALRRGGKRLLVVEAGTDSLKEVNLRSGKIRTIASNLGFYDPLPIPDWPPFDLFLNNVTVDNTGAIYVNADEANVIYKLRGHRWGRWGR